MTDQPQSQPPSTTGLLLNKTSHTKRLLLQLSAWRNPRTAADFRHRQIALAASTAAAAKVAGLLVAYVSVSLSIGKLGATAFGLWMTINSLSVLLPFADFGLGNGLVSFVALCIGESRVQETPGAISACLYMAAASGTILSLGGALAAHSPALGLIFRHQDLASMNEIIPAAMIFLVCLGLTLPLSIVEKVQMGAQDGYIANLWQILASAATLVGLYMVSRGTCNLQNLVLAYSGIPILFKLANSFLYFRLNPQFAPTLAAPAWDKGRQLLRSGFAFVILQSSVALGYTCDSIILAAQSGAVAVAEYNVVQRLNSLSVLTEFSIGPLWGAFGEALARGDVDWAKKTFYRSLRFNGILAISVSLILLAAAKPLINKWTNGIIHPGMLLLVSFALWKTFNVLQSNLSMLLNHERTLKKQTVFFVIAAIVSFALKFPLLKVFGTAGIVLATVLSFALIYAAPCLAIAAKLLTPAKSVLTVEVPAAAV